MAGRKKKKIPQRKTLLAVGEGDTEVAFLKYLRSIYCSGRKDSPKITPRNAHGGSPQVILDVAVRHKKAVDYDAVICVLDTDVSWPPEMKRDAHRHGIDLIANAPCIEALFLELLNEPVPYTTEACKKEIKKIVETDFLDHNTYHNWCSPGRLEDLAKKNAPLRQLLMYYK